MQATLIVLHVLGATVWTGGHLILTIGFLPPALRTRNPQIIQDFESRFERIGLPALALQFITGVILCLPYLPDPDSETQVGGHVLGLLGSKLILLFLTIGLALHARLRILPNLAPDRLRLLAAHVIAVTVLSVLFVVFGVGLQLAG
ncbi:MAG: CopD family protein [Planctomycetota bacterium]|jgi:putative copper export protein